MNLDTPAERAAYDQGMADTLALVDAVRAVVPTLLPSSGERPTLAELADGLARYDPQTLAILRPFNIAETLTVKQAARLAGCSPRAIAQWAEKYRIGRLVVGCLRISHPSLLMLLDDNALALAALLAGQRDHPAVRPYFERIGLSITA